VKRTAACWWILSPSCRASNSVIPISLARLQAKTGCTFKRDNEEKHEGKAQKHYINVPNDVSRSSLVMGARTICQQGHGSAVPFLKAPLTCAGRGGAEGGPSANPFFQPFPCPVKYVLFHRAGPARPQSKHVPSRESRGKAWSQDFLEGRPHPASPAPRGRGPYWDISKAILLKVEPPDANSKKDYSKDSQSTHLGQYL
jgi:hypothetical protein